MVAMSDDGHSPQPQPGQPPEAQPGPQEQSRAQAATATAATPIRRCRGTSAAGRSRPPPTAAACPSSAERPAGPPHARLSVVRSRAAGAQLADGAAFRHPGEPRVTVPFSPYFLNRSRPARSSRSPPRATRSRAPSRASCVPARRQDGHADEAIRDPGPELLERRQLEALLQDKQRRDQRRIDRHEDLAAGRAAARLRPDAADRRAVRAARPARRQRAAAGWAGSGTFGRSQRAGSTPRRSASPSPTWPGSTRQRPN